MQALHDIIEQLPQEFIETIKNCSDVARLREMRWETNCEKERAVINARIEHLNWLVS